MLLLAQLEHADFEIGRLAGKRRLAVVIREGDAEGLRVTFLEADQVVLKARNEALAANNQRHSFSRGTVNRLAVAANR